MPVLSEDIRKSRAVLVRMSQVEHAQVRAEAARRGLTISDYIRSLARLASGSLGVSRTDAGSPDAAAR